MSVVELEKLLLEAQNSNTQLEEASRKLELEKTRLRDELRLALYRKFGKSSENLVNQGELPSEETAGPEELLTTESDTQIIHAHSRKKPGESP